MKQTEIGNSIADDAIPEDWEVKALGEMGFTYNGLTGKSKNDFKNGDALYITFLNILNNIILNSRLFGKVKIKTLEEQNKAQKGDLFFNTSSETPEEVGICAILLDDINNLYLNSFCIGFRLTDFTVDGLYLVYFFRSTVGRELMRSLPQGSTRYNLSKDYFLKTKIPLPPLPEQRRIAQALSDVDSLITTLEKLVAKKTRVKQGAMSLLLSGKVKIENGTFAKCTRFKQTELGEIPADWEVREVGTLLKIGHGKDYKNLKHGTVPVFGTGGYMTSVSDFLYDGETVCIGRKGTIDKPFFHSGKIWTVDTLFYTYDFVDCIPKFIYYDFCLVDWLSMNEASGVPSLTSKNIENILLPVPPLAEQSAIAAVLSDMDAEITALNAKLAKYRQLKTAMMQQLLTGKIRLIEKSQSGHNRHFDDAVMIAAIVDAFYSPRYPLGRKKVQKLLYLMRRKQEADMSAFKKKAAGPYADEIRYKGGEPIAIRNKYVVARKNAKGTVFSRGEKINAALTYIQKWNMQADIAWLLDNFRYTRVDDLELFATIDMAMCDLNEAGIAVSVSSIKDLIRSNAEWKAKLSKSYFSDFDIARAIAKCKELFY
ncbi:MAG: restriction endonuclease subunit S [Treponema sp.]|nr:restriction endonuclease subunit S [Treponema sp.]